MGTDRFSRLFSGPTRESSARVQPEECTAEASVTTSSGSQPAPALVELDSTSDDGRSEEPDSVVQLVQMVQWEKKKAVSWSATHNAVDHLAPWTKEYLPKPPSDEEPALYGNAIEDATPEYLPMPTTLQNLVPPGKDAKPSLWHKIIPGYWEPPDGWGEQLNAADAMMWVVWWLVRAHPCVFFLSVCIILIQVVVTYMTTNQLNILFDEDTLTGDSVNFIVKVALFGVLCIVQVELSYWIRYVTPSGGKFIPDVQAELVKYLIQSPWEKVEVYRIGHVLAVATTDVELMDRVIVAMIDIISHTVIVCTQIVTLCLLDVGLMLVSSFCIVFLLLSMEFYSPRIFSTAAILRTCQADYTNAAQEVLAHGSMVRVLSLVPVVGARIDRLRLQLVQAYAKVKRVNLQSNRVADIICYTSPALLIAVGGLQVQNDVIHSSVIITFVVTMQFMLRELLLATKQVHIMEGSVPSLLKVTSICQDKILNCKNIPPTLEKQMDIVCSNVQFGYSYKLDGSSDLLEAGEEEDEQDDSAYSLASAFSKASFTIGSSSAKTMGADPMDTVSRLGSMDQMVDSVQVLKGVNFTVRAGMKVAIMGRSGCGKSTLLKILARLYKASDGHIRFGDVSVDHMDQLRTVAMVEQKHSGFNKSIRAFLTFGLEGVDAACVSEERLQRAAGLAGLLPTAAGSVGHLLDGIDTKERFEELNNSLQQRVLLARAIAQNTPVLLLDEPASAQDHFVRTEMGKSLRDLTYFVPSASGRTGAYEQRPVTVLASTHNFDLVESWDAIMFMADGVIAEYGPPEELLKKKGAFWRFHRKMDAVWAEENGQAGVKPAGLREVWPLAGLSKPALEALCESFKPQTFKQGDTLFAQGAAASTFYVVVSGQVEEFYKYEEENSSRAATLQKAVSRIKTITAFLPRKPGNASTSDSAHLRQGTPPEEAVTGGQIGFVTSAERPSSPGSEVGGAGDDVNHVARMLASVRVWRKRETGLPNRRSARYISALQNAGSFVRLVSTGDPLGIGALVPSESGERVNYSVTAVAKTDCLVVSIPRAKFMKWMKEPLADGAEDAVTDRVKLISSLRSENLMRNAYLGVAPSFAVAQLAQLMTTSMVDAGQVVWNRTYMPTYYVVVSGNVTLQCKAVGRVLTPADDGYAEWLERRLLTGRLTSAAEDATSTHVVVPGQAFGFETLLGIEEEERLLEARAASLVTVMALPLVTFGAWLSSNGDLQSAFVAAQLNLHAYREGRELAGLWPFCGLSEAQLRMMGSVLRPEIYSPKHPMHHHKGRNLSGVYVVMEGAVEVTLQNAFGQMVRVTRTKGLLNETSLIGLDPSIVKVSVKVLQDTLVLGIPTPEDMAAEAEAMGAEVGAEASISEESHTPRSAAALHGMPVCQHLCSYSAPFQQYLEPARLEALLASAKVDLDTAQMMALHAYAHTSAAAPQSALPQLDSPKEPRAIVVMAGTLEGRFKSSKGDYFQQAKAGDIVLNEAAAKMLNLGERLLFSTPIPWYAKHPNNTACAKTYMSDKVTASSAICIVADLDLNFDLRQTAALREKMQKEEADRMALVERVREAQTLVAAKERELGMRAPFNVPKLWRWACITVRRQLKRGIVYDQSSEVEGMLRDWPMDKLQGEMKDLRKRDDYVANRLVENRAKLSELRADWEAVGLDPQAPEVAGNDSDLSSERLARIETTVSGRTSNCRALLAAVMEEAEALWERKGTDHEERFAGRAAAQAGTVKALIQMEKLVVRLKASMRPMVQSLKDSLEAVWDDLGTMPLDRLPDINPDNWTLRDFLFAERQVRLVRTAMLKGGDMERNHLERIQREQLEAQDRELQSEREASAALKEQLAEARAVLNAQREVFAAVGYGHLTEQSDYSRAALKLQTHKKLEDSLRREIRDQAQAAQIAEMKPVVDHVRQTEINTAKKIYLYKDQIQELREQLAKATHVPEGADAVDLWRRGEALTEELGIDQPTARATGLELRAAPSGWGDKVVDDPVEAPTAMVEKLWRQVQRMARHKSLRRLLEEWECYVLYMHEVGTVDVYRQKAFTTLLGVDPDDHKQLADAMVAQAVELEETRNALVERREDLLRRCETALLAVGQQDLLEVIRIGTDPASGLDDETMQHLEKQTEKAEAWKELQDLDKATSTVVTEMKERIRLMSASASKKAKKLVKEEAKQKQMDIIQRKVELQERFGKPGAPAKHASPPRERPPESSKAVASAAFPLPPKGAKNNRV